MSSAAFSSPFGANSNPFSRDAKKVEPLPQVAENDAVGSSTGGARFRVPFGGDAASDGSQAAAPGAAAALGAQSADFPAHYNLGRRTSVSAESLKPMGASDSEDNWQPPHHAKTPEQLQRLQEAIGGNFLFRHLDEDQSSQVLGALVEKPIPARDIKVISQGDVGDYFYVVEKGAFDVYVNPKGSLQPGLDGMGAKVGRIEAGGSFGELALMYNAPRAATVVSARAGCVLWALDRVTFRRILMESTFARRRMYESFLEEVPLLSTLDAYERSKIADALTTLKYPSGSVIIREGDTGDSFYLLESGDAEASKVGVAGAVKRYRKGDFFGELALLNDAPRAATVTSTTEVKVATLGKSAFQRLLGPVESIMRRTKYDAARVESLDPLSKF